MGFSTSGAVAVMLIGILVAASVLLPTLFTIGNATGDAFSAQAEQIREQKNTDVTINSAENASGTLTVNVTNEGTVTLGISKTTLLVNGDYVSPDNTTVIDDGTETTETRIWPPGTHLELEVDSIGDEVDGNVERVKVVTETAVSDATEEIQ
ncbi:CARDB domain-containing protein [Halopiger djelfimassiliensis]|uniref:CARDB domain-containing protein n=1 Tax=Halopiger djelfimassiliensis TaxID=1293047 RepID=UPI000677C151|nr:CARDB domain-containing protein [Halopiger djelfimassiliensis]